MTDSALQTYKYINIIIEFVDDYAKYSNYRQSLYTPHQIAKAHYAFYVSLLFVNLFIFTEAIRTQRSIDFKQYTDCTFCGN